MDEARRHLPRFRSDQVAAQKLSGAGCLSFARRCFSLAGNSSTRTGFADPPSIGPLRLAPALNGKHSNLFSRLGDQLPEPFALQIAECDRRLRSLKVEVPAE